MPFSAKLQITPNAYRFARKVTSPRLMMIVTICSTTITLMIRCDVPNFGCGCRNQSGSTPSSETRFSTPFDPTMAVFTAPERISVPTTTTNTWNASRATNGPVQTHRQAADQVLEELRPYGVRNDHHREERNQRGEHHAVDENHQRRFFQVRQLGMLDFAIDLRERFFAAHGQHRMPQAHEDDRPP